MFRAGVTEGTSDSARTCAVQSGSPVASFQQYTTFRGSPAIRVRTSVVVSVRMMLITLPATATSRPPRSAIAVGGSGDRDIFFSRGSLRAL